MLSGDCYVGQNISAYSRKHGHHTVLQLVHDMNESRMLRLGFTDEEAASLAGLHTRNFM